ncbi:hypothetical protein [Aureimonas psammosilenae]|uniref:hypothetical protein n=1 Tax=Aureimonas psammosilenae TaxID=2495496 RepID=UPI00186A25DE|nr:hypothetical protein [Aureimonas psammosilenae]
MTATENPNHKMPPGKPLDPETAVPEGGGWDAPSEGKREGEGKKDAEDPNFSKDGRTGR